MCVCVCVRVRACICACVRIRNTKGVGERGGREIEELYQIQGGGWGLLETRRKEAQENEKSISFISISASSVGRKKIKKYILSRVLSSGREAK